MPTAWNKILTGLTCRYMILMILYDTNKYLLPLDDVRNVRAEGRDGARERAELSHVCVGLSKPIKICPKICPMWVIFLVTMAIAINYLRAVVISLNFIHTINVFEM